MASVFDITLQAAQKLGMARMGTVRMTIGDEYFEGYSTCPSTDHVHSTATPGSATVYFAQSYTPSIDVYISAIRVNFAVGDIATDDYWAFWLDIYDDDGDKPGSMIHPSCMDILSDSPAAAADYDIGFEDGLVMFAGVKYWIVMGFWCSSHETGDPIAGKLTFTYGTYSGADIMLSSLTSTGPWADMHAGSGLYMLFGETGRFTCEDLDEPDDFFNGGTMWMVGPYETGQLVQVMDYEQAQGIFATNPILYSVGPFDRFWVLDARYPLPEFYSAINAALAELGPFDAYYDYTVTDGTQTDYAMPTVSGSLTYDPKRVQFSRETAAPYTFGAIDRWWVYEDDEIHLSPNHLPRVGQKIRIWYEQPHPVVTNYVTDTITNDVPADRLATLAALYLVRWRNSRADTTDQPTQQLEQKLQAMVLKTERQYPIHRKERDSHWSDL